MIIQFRQARFYIPFQNMEIQSHVFTSRFLTLRRVLKIGEKVLIKHENQATELVFNVSYISDEEIRFENEQAILSIIKTGDTFSLMITE